jgi:hypothetical protein
MHNMSFFSLYHTTSVYYDPITTIIIRLGKMLLDRIEDLRGRIHKAHNSIYNETVMIEIETLQWVLSQIDRTKQ